MQRGVVWFSLFALVAGSFAGCLDDGSSLFLERPEWASGFSFAYEVSGESRGEEKHVGGDDSGERSEKETIEPSTYVLHILNTSLRNGDVPIYLGAVERQTEDQENRPPSVASMGWPQLDIRAFRQRDLAAVDAYANIDRDCQPPSNPAEPPVCTAQMGMIQYGPDPELTYLDFPLETGKSWSKATQEGSDFGDALRWDVEAKVGKAASVDLPMGTVRALPVEFTFTPTNIDEFIREAKEDEDAQLESLEYRPYQHLKVFYAQDYQTVVRSESVMRLDYTASGKDEDGNRMAAEGHFEARIQQVLVGARLVAMPERDLDYIGQVVMGEIQLGDPSGQARRAAGYTLEVQPSQSVLNAAEKPKLSFEAKVVGDPAEFSGHTATWRLLNFLGAEVATGQGLTGSVPIEDPGYYTIEVEARDAEDQVTAGASAFVVANYEAVVPVVCPAIVVDPLLPGCPSAPVPVRPGIQKVTVGTQLTGPIVPLVRNALVLTDGADQMWEDRTAQQSAHEIIVDDFAEATVGSQDWTMYLEQSLAVSQGVAYTISLSYAPTGAVEPESSPERSCAFAVPGVGAEGPCVAGRRGFL